jgi:hypothetical protein
MFNCERQASLQTPRGAIGAEYAGLFLALVGAALVRIDGVLEGMIGAGLGVDAISQYLGCARTHILDELAARGANLTRQHQPIHPREIFSPTIQMPAASSGAKENPRVGHLPVI